MPRSPTNVTVPPPKWPTTFFTCEATVLGSEVLPANTSIDKGVARHIVSWGNGVKVFCIERGYVVTLFRGLQTEIVPEVLTDRVKEPNRRGASVVERF